MRAILLTICFMACAGSAAARSPALEKVAQDRVAAARNRLPPLRDRFHQGKSSLAELLAAMREVAFAARDSGLQGDALIAPLTEYRDGTRKSLLTIEQRHRDGVATDSEVASYQYNLAEAEYWLAEAQEKK